MSIYRRRESPASKQATELSSEYGLEYHGLTQFKRVYWNLPIPALMEEIVLRGEGYPNNIGAVVVDTGKRKGSASDDRFIVREPTTEDRIW